MEVRIGVTQSPREVEIELTEGTDVAKISKQIEDVLKDEKGVLWLTDRKGRTICVPGSKINYIEISSREERRVGFAQ